MDNKEVPFESLDAMITDIVNGIDQLGSEAVRPVTGRWRIVIHGGIDGYSRLIVFLRASNNDCSSTVMSYFLNAMASFDAKRPGVVLAKTHHDAQPVEYQLLRDGADLPPIDGLPVLAPPGLNIDRQTYLYEKNQAILC
ncbi:hypothetical protein cypCar_00038673 [Cyprinus carpio]|nr:hypothetical protein cypCar_00038673 [Cyprinus carpio]